MAEGDQSPPGTDLILATLQNAVTAINNLGLSDLLTEATINSTTAGNHTIISAQSGLVASVYSLFLVVGSSVDITFMDGSATNLTGPLSMTANSALFLDNRKPAWFTCVTNSAFVINTSAAAQVSGRCYYIQE